MYTTAYRYPQTIKDCIKFAVTAILTQNQSMLESRAFDSCFENSEKENDIVALAVYDQVGELAFTKLCREVLTRLLREREETTQQGGKHAV